MYVAWWCKCTTTLTFAGEFVLSTHSDSDQNCLQAVAFSGCCAFTFNLQKDEWSLKSPMSTRRSALSIAVLDKDVYVIGGYDGNASLSSVEVLVCTCTCMCILLSVCNTDVHMHVCATQMCICMIHSLGFCHGG